MILGAHESIAGGVAESIARAEADGCEALQIFTKSSNRWAAKPIEADEAAEFRGEVERAGLSVIAHDAYLINLAAPDDEVWEKSVAAFAHEIERCSVLGIPWLVAHPGAPKEAGEAFGIERIAKGLDAAFDLVAADGAGVLLETTAGQGSNLGWRFEHLRDIIGAARREARLGVCLDTCHVFAAGYDLTTREGYDALWEEFGRVVGFDRLRAFHLNDSKKPLGSRVDRHHRIGEGHIGEEPFRWLVNDARFADITAVLETPPLDDGTASFASGLIKLRSFEG
ncbi:MAG: deoxyribonuclease IV [Gemmatimonadetes bacterium]|nr:deoxyribonuclease IV [Gemmatimonadota bacterium]